MLFLTIGYDVILFQVSNTAPLLLCYLPLAVIIFIVKHFNMYPLESDLKRHEAVGFTLLFNLNCYVSTQ